MRSDRNIKRSAANSTKNRRTGSYIPPAQQRPAQPGASSRSAHYDWSVKTTGEVFSNGSSIELLRESKSEGLTLLFSDGEKRRIAPRVEIGDRAFVPPELSPAMSQR